MSDTQTYLYIYGSITVLLGSMGIAVSTSTADWQAKQLGARLALTCWAWPLWLLIGFGQLLRYLWDRADW